MVQDGKHVHSGGSNHVNAIDNERTPLIRVAPDHRDASSRHSAISLHSPLVRKRLVIIILCLVLIILLEVGTYLVMTPLNQVMEEIICRNLLPNVELASNDSRCKDNAVQSELSFIRGWMITLGFIPGVLTAVPYGSIADRRGRGPVLSLSLLGITMSNGFYVLICSLPSTFPTRAVWLSSVLTFIGGGATVFGAVVFTIVGDIVSEEQRSTTFFYIATASIIGPLIASPLMYVLMNLSIWLTIYGGLGCLILATIIAFLLPEAIPTEERQRHTEVASPDDSHLHKKFSGWTHIAREQLVGLRKGALWLARGNGQIAILLFTFLVTTLGRFAQEMLLQYVTKRYGWSWSQASLLLSLQAFFNLILFTALLPFLGNILVRTWMLSAQGKDLWLARASVFLLTVGAFIIGLSNTSILMSVGLGFFSLGAGYPFLMRSLLASIVERQHVGIIFTVVGIFETIGALVAGPLLAASFRTGMEWDGVWIGLPYDAAACLCATAGIALSSMSVSDLEHKAAERNDESDSEY